MSKRNTLCRFITLTFILLLVLQYFFNIFVLRTDKSNDPKFVGLWSNNGITAKTATTHLAPKSSRWNYTKATTANQPDNSKINNNNTGCQIFFPDPFHLSLAKYFNYEPYAPCSQWKSPFAIQPPNFFQLKNDKKWKRKLRDCFYTVIEGQKGEKKEEEEAKEELEKEGPKTAFDGTERVQVNGSFARVQCLFDNNKETHFLNLPYRPKKLGVRKMQKQNSLYSSSSRSSSSSSSSSTSSSSSRPFFSVYVIGIDSVSRAQSFRHLPKTRSFLLSPEMNATEFRAYNKVALNTLANWAAMHTGWPYDEKSKSQVF